MARYEQQEEQLCGSVEQWWRELVPVGGGHFISWVSHTGDVRLWSLGADGTFAPTTANFWPTLSNRLLVGLGHSRLLKYDQRDASSEIWSVDLNAQGLSAPLPFRINQFSLGRELAGRDFLAIDDDHLLEWTPGNGAFRVLLIDHAHEDTDPLPETPFNGTLDVFRRGHQWAALGDGRLLEWVPLTGAFRVWGFDLTGAPGNPISAQPLSTGTWSDLGIDHQIMVIDAGKILIWNRQTGELDLRAFDPRMPDPLSGPPISRGTFKGLTSLPHGWPPPTTSPIKRVVLLLQDGRSFDTYFGQHCQAPPGSDPACTDGPACCEAMPDTTDGATGGCHPIDLQSPEFVPSAGGDCLADEIDQGRMDHFVTSTLPGCGDPRNFACAVPAAPGPDVVDVSTYRAFASGGALADRFFQSFQGSAEINFLFLAHGGFGLGVTGESGEQITSQLAEKNVPWALYLSDPDRDTQGQVPPIYYDGHWSHLRFLDEFTHDVTFEELAPVSAVIAPAGLNENPGSGRAADGIRLIKSMVDSVLGSSRYKDETLVLLAYFTGGGFYDHVSPPHSNVDRVPYGPRVPLLALGPFARGNTVSHVQMELGSLTKFVEWNWFHGQSGQLRGRDLTAHNIGSLLIDEIQAELGADTSGP
ncbi:MAG TPA: alkaline phosphatase family protein [Polyangia bacterium]|nr:alkaline phosphatase family protein [Polyangia bacterium]